MIFTLIFFLVFFILLSIIGVIIGHYKKEDLNDIDTIGGILVFIGLVGLTLFGALFFLCIVS